MNRLIRFDEGFLVGNVIPNPIDTEVYGLDGVGNRKQHEKNGQLFSNSVDSMNRYAASYNGSLTLDYDSRGNTTKYGDLDLTYDVYGKLVGAEKPNMTAVYLYDASDRRVMSQVNDYATYFVLEGDRVLQEVDGTSAHVTKEYAWGSAIDELVILQLDGEIYHAHADALGSTALLTDANGDVVERYDYNPFGACVASDINGGGLVGNPYRFTGRRLDSETSLYYYRARHYSTEMGRFLSRDPIGIWGDAGNFGNAYAYAGNNPGMYSDPGGTKIDIICVPDYPEFFLQTACDLMHIEMGFGCSEKDDGDFSNGNDLFRGLWDDPYCEVIIVYSNERAKKIAGAYISDKGEIQRDSCDAANAYCEVDSSGNVTQKGVGCLSIVIQYDPFAEMPEKHCGWENGDESHATIDPAQPFTILAHELVHADNNRLGITPVDLDDEHAMNMERENKTRKKHRKDGVTKRLPQTRKTKKALEKFKKSKNNGQNSDKKNNAHGEKGQTDDKDKIQD